ncbi:MAG TPA: sialate O-acetylesterase [Pirellulales bacterium]|nr:sialate O-acetylesterase [Pirellulales bacterium]
MKFRLHVIATVSTFFVVAAARADVKLPGVFSSHMVLQREMPISIWGTAATAEQVTVKFRDQQQTTKADKHGQWKVKLDPLTAGGPDVLSISGKNTITLDDVLVGEVWVGSGQSNMAGAVRGYATGDPVLKSIAAKAPYAKIRLIRDGAKGVWKEATPQEVDGFSALLFPFGVRLQEELDVPIGLMLGAVGGTPSSYWLSEKAYQADAGCKRVVDEYAKTDQYDKAMQAYERYMKAHEAAVEAAKKAGKQPPRAPQKPLQAGEPRGKIGNLYEAYIRPFVGYGIRGVLWDQGEAGTAIGGLDQYTMMGALIRGWRNEWGQGDFPFLYVQKPSGGGCAWDPNDPVTDKAEPFSDLPSIVPADGQFRETHIRIMTYPNTGIVISSDLGPMTHPTNKSGYGTRASRVALGMVYGKSVEYYGPVYESHQVEGDKVRVRFTHVGRGLAYAHGERLQGFAIAGPDKKFAWAEATIDGDSVLLGSPDVANPVAVRYGWSQRHPWANLFNCDGLPALAFRTDKW